MLTTGSTLSRPFLIADLTIRRKPPVQARVQTEGDTATSAPRSRPPRRQLVPIPPRLVLRIEIFAEEGAQGERDRHGVEGISRVARGGAAAAVRAEEEGQRGGGGHGVHHQQVSCTGSLASSCCFPCCDLGRGDGYPSWEWLGWWLGGSQDLWVDEIRDLGWGKRPLFLRWIGRNCLWKNLRFVIWAAQSCHLAFLPPIPHCSCRDPGLWEDASSPRFSSSSLWRSSVSDCDLDG